MSSPVDGLVKRPNTRHIAKVHTGTLADAYVHTINRGDNAERYEVVITNGDIQVFDLMTGEEKAVYNVDGTTPFNDPDDYFTTATPGQSFRAVTVQDYTYLVNRDIEVEMAADLSADPGNQALVWVKQGVSATDYKIHTKLTAEAEKTATYNGGATAAHYTTTRIADQLIDNTGSYGSGNGLVDVWTTPAEWDVIRKGNVIQIERNTAPLDFNIRVEDGFGDNGISVVKGKAQRFTDLPDKATKGYKIEINGDPDSAYDNYWVEFETLNDINTIDAGSWVESIAPGIPYKLDHNTLPHVLVKQADGSFICRKLAYANRTVGDEDSNPDPSFVGKKINDIFFHKNRLGFLTQQNVVLSESGTTDKPNFFRTTVLTLLDSDPIDIATADTKVADMYFAISFQEQILMFSDQAQYILSGGDLLTPKTAAINQSTAFVSSRTAAPVALGKNVYFAELGAQYTAIREFYADPDSDVKDAADITAHVPKYLQGSATKLAGSSNGDVLAVLTDDSPNTIYFYKYLWAGDDKLQSSWSVWEFGNRVLHVSFIDTVAYLLIQRDDGVYIECIDIEGGPDPYVNFATLLDRRVNSDDLTMSYDAGADETTITLPYPLSVGDDIRATTRGVDWDTWTSNPPGNEPDEEDREYFGVDIEVLSFDGDEVVVTGDMRGVPLWLGIGYNIQYRFSTFYPRMQDRNGSETSVTGGRTQVRKWSVVFTDSGPFTVTVAPYLREPSEYEFSNILLDTPEGVLDTFPLQSGTASVPVMSKNDQVYVEINSDSHLPVKFVTANVEYFTFQRSQKV